MGCSSESDDDDEYYAVESISISSFSDTISLNNEYTVSPVFTPTNATNQNFTISADQTWVTVDNTNHTIKPTEEGTFNLTVTSAADSTKTDTKAITVKVVELTGISLALSDSVYIGGTANITVTYTPSDASYKDLTWSSSDEKVATVSNGVVTGVAEGTATITAKSSKYENVSGTLSVTVSEMPETTITIQENASAGFVSTTGSVATTFAGYTGSGYIDGVVDGGNIVYIVNASKDITDAKIALKYCNTESSRMRGAYIKVNGTLVNGNSPIGMTYTFKGNKTDSSAETVAKRWLDSQYVTGISLNKGSNTIIVYGAPAGTYSEAGDGTSITIDSGNSGCLNYVDYLIVVGKGISAGSASGAKSYYTLSYSSENSTAGSVTSETATGSVEEDSSVTLTAIANDGWKFECWTDGTTSNPYTFTVSGNKYVMAHFVPESYTAPSGLVGYATVTSDSGNAYTITGGAGGETITISSLSDMESNKDKLSSDTPYIVKVTGTATTSDNVSVYYSIGSNKTLYSADGSGRFKNVEVRVSGSNVIIRNLKFGEVIADDTYGGSGNDALSLNGARHVWIDHCELFSHLSPQDNSGNAITTTTEAKDFYDGLLDIKNGATWITISNCYLHDHWKAVLCGSSESQADGTASTGLDDSDMRVTFYGNYFYNINSRQPLFRWGKAHLFNNYFNSPSTSSDTYQNSNCIDVRVDSQVLAEANYFSGVKNAIGLDLANGGSDSTGSAGYSFPSSNVVDSTCKNTPSSSGGSYSYIVPYSYSDSMTTASTNPATNAGANLTSLSY